MVLLRRSGRRIVSDEDAEAGSAMPAVRTILDGLLQMAVIGLGASAGRELAPRQMGALVGAWLSERVGLSAQQRRALVACGAGAGLAAVDNVPLGAAIFALEVLYLGMGVPIVVMALTTSAIAATVGSFLVPDAPLFALDRLEAPPPLYVWAIVGPVFGLGGAWFARSTVWLVAHRPKDVSILWVTPLTFAVIGLLSWPFPQILGDGVPLSKTAFDASTPLVLLGVLIGVKAVTTRATYASGAAGGTLHPLDRVRGGARRASGGRLEPVLAGHVDRGVRGRRRGGVPRQRDPRPISALVLTIEYTGQSYDFFVPMMVASAGSAIVGRLIEQRHITGPY